MTFVRREPAGFVPGDSRLPSSTAIAQLEAAVALPASTFLERKDLEAASALLAQIR